MFVSQQCVKSNRIKRCCVRDEMLFFFCTRYVCVDFPSLLLSFPLKCLSRQCWFQDHCCLRVSCQIVGFCVIAWCIWSNRGMNATVWRMQRANIMASVSFVYVNKCWRWSSYYSSLPAAALSHSLRRNSANKVELLKHIFEQTKSQMYRHVIKHIFHRDDKRTYI